MNSRLFVCQSIVTLGLLSAQAQSQTLKKQGTPGTDSAIQQILDDRVAEGRAIGLVVAKRDADGVTRIYHAGSSGKQRQKLDGNSVFEIGSVTKTFITALLADMVVKGEVKLDDPVSIYLPPMVKMPVRNGRQITLADLATHSSGLPFLPDNLSPDIQRSWAEYTNSQLYVFLSVYQITREIGSKFEYSDTGLGLLGHVLAQRAGETWEQAVTDRILIPLNMNETRQAITPLMRHHMTVGHDKCGQALPPWEFLSLPGLGALRSTANDLIKYLEANMNPPDISLGKALALTHVSRRDAFSTKTQIGLGWFLGVPANRNIVFHGGSTPGYNSFVGFDPVKRTAVVVLADSDCDVSDIGLHLLEPSALIDDDPPKIRVLYAELMKSGFEIAVKVVATKKRNDPGYSLPEKGVNTLGYRLLGQKRLKKALEIFKLNVHLYLQSADAFDSLAEGYEVVGNKDLAIHNYERSLELNSKNTNAAEHLVKLKSGR
jgi:D-alanyl-D-alanine-carboxypeptidase/D-alanyl-D-alanine-endopeptidase